METKLYDAKSITLDGRMDEPVWASVQEYTGFRQVEEKGGQLAERQTFFRILPCEDRIYIGIKCMEPDMEYLKSILPGNIYHANAVEIFLSPTGSDFDFYSFVCSFDGQRSSHNFSERGVTQHIQNFEPAWSSAVYAGEDYWSVEIEIPLIAFYVTPTEQWSDTWLVNIARTIFTRRGSTYTSWQLLKTGYIEPTRFKPMEGFPIRPARNHVAMQPLEVALDGYKNGIYYGTMTVTATTPVDDEYTFTSDHADSAVVAMKAGQNVFTVPCRFDAQGRTKVSQELKRKSDGLVFKCHSVVRIAYDPIQLLFTLPECRCNFYPGQDYSKIVGKVIADQPVTLTLEGPGIETTVISPNEDGSFRFETPNFEIGEAFLTASIDGWEVKQKIRRLAPSEHMMTWISGGNLIVNGKPVLRRNMFAPYYRGGMALRHKYETDNLHDTRELQPTVSMQPGVVYPEAKAAGGESHRDGQLSEEMRRRVDAIIEKNKNRDFSLYYLADEPSAAGYSPVYMKNLYNYITDKDPYHVVNIATEFPGRWTECADWLETDPYICPVNTPDGRRYLTQTSRGRVMFDDFAEEGRRIDEVAMANRPDKCIGFLPTCFSYPPTVFNKFDYPTLDEYIAHTWEAMIHGAKTLWPYAYHDLADRAAIYEGTRYIFSTFEALENIVLLGKRTVLTRTTEVDAVLYETEDEKMFALVNITPKPQRATLNGIDGQWYAFRSNRPITGNTFELKPFEVVIGTSKVKDTGLPTYEEVAALVDKLEYERTHGGSLLFNRAEDIEVLPKGSNWCDRKLFDGVRDNLAVGQEMNVQGYCELNLTKVRPNFNKVVISGYNVDDMELKVRYNGELSAPAIAEVIKEQWSTTFILKETICPDCLRMEFNKETVELYEVEVF